MKNKMLFYQMFLPIFIIGMVLVIGFSLFIYTNTYDSIEENYLLDKQNLLKQIKTNVEWKFRTIEYSFATYGSTKNFSEIFQSPLNHTDYAIYSEVRKELNFIETIAMEENAFKLVSLKGGWGVVNGSLNQLSPQEATDLKAQYVHQDQQVFWTKQSDGIEMVVALPKAVGEKYALGFASIDHQALKRIIERSNEDRLTIYYGAEILFTDAESSREGMITVKNIEANVPTVVQRNGRNFILLQSDYNQWQYQLEIDPATIGTTVRNLQIGLATVSFTLIILLGGLSYIFSERYVRPISQIQDRLNLHSEGLSGKKLENVVQSVSQVIGENELLSANLITQKPQLETLFVLSLFRNRVEKRELDQRLQQFNYDSQNECYYTAIVQIDLLEESHGGERDLLLLAINQMIAEIVPKEERMIPIVLNEEMQATIYRSPKEEVFANKKVMDHCRQIQKMIQEYLKLTVSIGISDCFTTLNDSKQSVDQAKEALYHRVNTGPNSIVFYHEIISEQQEKTLIKYPMEKQNRLFEAIRSGNEHVSCLLHELIVEMFTQNKNRLNREVVAIRLVNEFVQLGQLLGVNITQFEELKQIYVKVLYTYHPQELEQLLLEQFVQPITKSSQEITEQEFKSLSEKMIHIIYSEYDRDLSLDMVADRLHYNPNYLSNVFKKETGENFGDFIQNYRLEIAKKWLTETTLSVKEIAERLKYRNSQNFIRFFKKKESVTPGEYRKKNR